MKKQARLFVLLLLLLATVLTVSACGGDDEGDDLWDSISSALSSYLYTGTTAPATTAAPPSATAAPDVTAAPPNSDAPLSSAELEDFLELVDYEKVSTAQFYYAMYYIGEFRTVESCSTEIFDTLSALPGIRTVDDREDATALFIDVYARMLGDYYGYYYAPTDYSDYTDDLEGEYVGIGVSVSVGAEGYAEILNVFPGSPAEEVGILPGDVIVAVEGEDFALIGYQNAIDRIRGKEGTAVGLTIERDGVRIGFSVTRRPVTEVTVDSRMLDGNIGYIRIVSFNERTYEQFVAAHRTLEASGAVAYVFDVRYNPGGTLNSVVAMLEYILPDGPIVHLNYKNDVDDATIDSIYDINRFYMDGVDRVYYEDHAIEKPMVVLANGNTASAGELFTSSLGDYGVATVIGEKTYGKGVGQSSLRLDSDGSALVLTVFSYDPPTSPNYDGVGILPDIEVSLSEEAAGKNLYKLTYEEDAQLQAAVAALASGVR